MAYIGLGLGVGTVTAVLALFLGAGLLGAFLIYAGAGSAVMLSGVAASMMFEDTPKKIEEDPMLLPRQQKV